MNGMEGDRRVEGRILLTFLFPCSINICILTERMAVFKFIAL